MIFIQVLHLLKAPFLFLCEFMDPIWNNVYHVCLFRFLSYNNWLLRFLFIYLFIHSFINSFIHSFITSVDSISCVSTIAALNCDWWIGGLRRSNYSK